MSRGAFSHKATGRTFRAVEDSSPLAALFKCQCAVVNNPRLRFERSRGPPRNRTHRGALQDPWPL